MAKYLEVRKDATKASITQQDVDNKMMQGTRSDQRSDARRTPTSPKVLALADQLGVDIAHVEPTGKGNQITEADVRKAAEDPRKRLPGSAQISQVNAPRDQVTRNTTTDSSHPNT